MPDWADSMLDLVESYRLANTFHTFNMKENQVIFLKILF